MFLCVYIHHTHMHVLYLLYLAPPHTLLYTLIHFLPSGTRSTLTSLQWGVADVSSFFYFNAHAQLGSYGMHVSYGNHTAPLQDDHVGESSDALIHTP